jgi:hypothetical protein
MTNKELTQALECCFTSPNVADSNFEAANVVDALDRIGSGIFRVGKAITPADAAPLRTPTGGRVESLTEAVVYASENLGRIADAISELAVAISEARE